MRSFVALPPAIAATSGGPPAGTAKLGDNTTVDYTNARTNNWEIGGCYSDSHQITLTSQSRSAVRIRR